MIVVGVRSGSVIPPGLFNMYKDTEESYEWEEWKYSRITMQ